MSFNFKSRGKTFLNGSHEEFGYVSWYVKPYQYLLSEKPNGFDAELKISDCHGTINLDFECSEFNKIDSRIEKLGTLISELEKFKEALLTAKEKSTKKFYY